MDRDPRSDTRARAAPKRFRSAAVVRLVLPRGWPLETVVAERFALRLVGLCRLRAADARALLIPRCSSVHTGGLRFEIDVAFLAGDPRRGPARVLSVHPRVGPRRLVAERRRGEPSVAVLELPSGAARALGIAPQAILRVDPAGARGRRRLRD